MSGLNWRQILIHFFASWFFMHAFVTLAYLYDIKLLDILRHSSNKDLNQKLIDNNISASDLVHFLIWIRYAGYIGILVALIISIGISIKRGWFWLNSIIVLIMSFVVYRFEWTGWAYLRRSFWRIGRLFSDTRTEILINVFLLLSIGILILFLRTPTDFIERGRLKHGTPAVGRP
jgi:hypothetical protein